MSTQIKTLVHPTVPKPVEYYNQNKISDEHSLEIDFDPVINVESQQHDVSHHPIPSSDNDIKVYIHYDYSPKSFLIYGEDNDKYKSVLMEAGGRFNPKYFIEGNGYVPGWCFSNKRIEQVEDLYKKIVSGEITPVDPGPKSYSKRGTPKTSSICSSVPKGSKTVCLPSTCLSNQTFTYTVVKPQIGVKATIKMTSGSYLATVVEIPTSPYNTGNKVGRIRASLDSDSNIIYTLAVVNGEWQILGTLDQHEIVFTV